jgi:hypothetical protein
MSAGDTWRTRDVRQRSRPAELFLRPGSHLDLLHCNRDVRPVQNDVSAQHVD